MTYFCARPTTKIAVHDQTECKYKQNSYTAELPGW